MTKFKVGDQVKTITPQIGYPQYLNRIWVVTEAHTIQGIDEYSLYHKDGGSAWHQNEELELVHRPAYK